MLGRSCKRIFGVVSTRVTTTTQFNRFSKFHKSKTPRDMKRNWTAEELDEFKVAFKSIPSFNNVSIPSSDISLMAEALNVAWTAEQMVVYKKFWDHNHGGRIPLEVMLNILSVVHDNAKATLERAQAFDKNGDGFISKDEFTDLMEVMIAHQPQLKGVPYEEFVKAADTNKDGRVSLQECADWIERNMWNT